MILGISGKKNSGKDTVAKIIQLLIYTQTHTNITVKECLDDKNLDLLLLLDRATGWQKKQFAGKLKEIVCLLIGCTLEQLEDREFKEKELGEEWWYYKEYDNSILIPYLSDFINDGRAKIEAIGKIKLYKLTPRKLFQLLGTECGRQIIHPNIWVNVLINDYKPLVSASYYTMDLGASDIQREKIGKTVPIEYPNWIITDVRFPNELKAIEDKGGIVIRINRPFNLRVKQYDRTCIECMKSFNFSEAYYPNINDKTNFLCPYCHSFKYAGVSIEKDKHESETALDSHMFKHGISNDRDLEYLIQRVKEILQDLKII